MNVAPQRTITGSSCATHTTSNSSNGSDGMSRLEHWLNTSTPNIGSYHLNHSLNTPLIHSLNLVQNHQLSQRAALNGFHQSTQHFNPQPAASPHPMHSSESYHHRKANAPVRPVQVDRHRQPVIQQHRAIQQTGMPIPQPVVRKALPIYPPQPSSKKSAQKPKPNSADRQNLPFAPEGVTQQQASCFKARPLNSHRRIAGIPRLVPHTATPLQTAGSHSRTTIPTTSNKQTLNMGTIESKMLNLDMKDSCDAQQMQRGQFKARAPPASIAYADHQYVAGRCSQASISTYNSSTDRMTQSTAATNSHRIRPTVTPLQTQMQQTQYSTTTDDVSRLYLSYEEGRSSRETLVQTPLDSSPRVAPKRESKDPVASVRVDSGDSASTHYASGSDLNDNDGYQSNDDAASEASNLSSNLSVDSGGQALARRPTFKTLYRKQSPISVSYDSFDNGAVLQGKIAAYRTKLKKNKSDASLQFEFAKYMIQVGDPYLDEGFLLLRKAASSGIHEARCLLAQAYADDGQMDRAYSQWMLAAKKFYPPACYQVARLSESDGPRRNLRFALEMYTKAATAGHQPSMFRLGTAELKAELGTRGGVKAAVKWFKRGSAGGAKENANCIYELVKIYEGSHSHEVSPDEGYARSLLFEAADLMFHPALNKLGYCFENGLLGCPVSPVESIKLYREAAKQGNSEAQLSLAGWYMTGYKDVLEQNEQKAFELAKDAASQRIPRAVYTLGYFYEMGIGVPKNEVMAVQLYKDADGMGEPRAAKRLKLIFPSVTEGPKVKKGFFGIFRKSS